MRFVKFSCLVTIALITLTEQARADAWDVMVVNSTGKTVRALELAITPAAAWQGINQTENGSMIKNGGRAVVHFDKPNNKCQYDLKALFDDGASAVWSKINVCDNSYVTIHYVNNKATYTAN